MRFETIGEKSKCAKFTIKINEAENPDPCKPLKFVKKGTEVEYAKISKTFEFNAG